MAASNGKKNERTNDLDCSHHCVYLGVVMFYKPDIVTVIEPYLNLKKAGKYYKSACPFHAENHPSFIVDPIRQRYHCFGCGADGDSIQFTIQFHSIPFKEALKQLGINGKPYKPDLKEIRKRKLLQQFRQWCNDFYDDLCSLYRTLQKAKGNAKTIEAVEALAEFYHLESVWIHYMEVLTGGDNKEKLDLYREVECGY